MTDVAEMLERIRAERNIKSPFEGGFIRRPTKMLESPAYFAASLSLRRLLDCLDVELARRKGRGNGNLIRTFAQFEKDGIRRHSIASAQREGEALGLLRVTEHGTAGHGDTRRPNKYRLTYMPTDDAPPTNEWQRIETRGQAEAIARAARRFTFPPHETGGGTPPHETGGGHPPKRGVLSK